MFNVLPAPSRYRRMATLSALAALAVAVGAVVGLQSATGSPRLASTTGVFQADTRPVLAAERDNQAVELGAAFHVTIPGSVVGVRFYKSKQNTGVHTGALWTASGSLLARVTFTNETSEGWQTATFAKPIPITAGRTYVVGYHTDTGYYAQQEYAFARGKTIGNGVVVETKGLYRYGAEGFPTSSWHDSSYYVDVLFSPATGSLASNSAAISRALTTTTEKTSTSKNNHRHLGKSTPTVSSSNSVSSSTSTGSTSTTGSSASQSSSSTSTSPTSSSSSTSTPTKSASASSSPSNNQTSSPSSTQTSSALVGCWAKPSACGYPDATNTGVQPGVTLTPSGSRTITQNGAVVQNLLITGELDIFANNVTVRNVKIVATGGYHALYTGWNYSGIVIDHVEIDGRHLNPSVPGLVGSGFTATALNIHGTGDAIDIGDNVTIRDSWIHDLTVNSGDHTDGVQSTGSDNDLITHSTIDATLIGGGVANSALIIGADLSDMGTVNVTNNLLGGGNYTLFAGADPGYSSGVINFSGNRFARNARYGPCSFAPSSGHTIGFTNNIWDSDGSPVTCS